MFCDVPYRGVFSVKKEFFMNNLLAKYAIDVFAPIAKWLSLGIALAVVITGIILFFAKKELFGKYLKISLFCLFVFFLVIGITGLILEICKKYGQTYAAENGIDPKIIAKYVLIPITVLLAMLLASAIACALAVKRSSAENVKNNFKKALTICGITDILALIGVGVMLGLYFDTVKEWYPTLKQAALYVSAVVLVAVTVALALLCDRSKKPFDTRCIAMAGVTLAMSYGLSYIKLWEMPQGGAVTFLSLLPVMVFSFIYGTKKGVFVCFIYGILQAVQDPWIIHPAQFLLDYPIAFAAIGLTGIFADSPKLQNKPQLAFLFGALLSSGIRFASHVLSGIFAFPSAEMSPFLFSLLYNSFVFVDLALVLVGGLVLFSSKTFVKELTK